MTATWHREVSSGQSESSSYVGLRAMLQRADGSPEFVVSRRYRGPLWRQACASEPQEWVTSGRASPANYILTGALERLHGSLPVGLLKYLVRLARSEHFDNLRAISATLQVLKRMAEGVDGGIPVPHVLATADGEIGLDWALGASDFTVEVLPSGRIEWFWQDTDTGEDDEGEVNTAGDLPVGFVGRFAKVANAR